MSGGGFINDGSFLEKFKQMQETSSQQPEQRVISASSSKPASNATPSPLAKGSVLLTVGKGSGLQKAAPSNGGAKLAFGFKQKAKPVVNPLFKTVDEDEENVGKDNSKRRKTDGMSASGSLRSSGAPPAPPSDPEVQKVADKLAVFVAKNGRNLENITRQKNPGDTPFRFLFDDSSPEYKYYGWRVSEEEKKLKEAGGQSSSERSIAGSGAAPRNVPYQSAQRPSEPTQYQTSSAALYAGAAPAVEPPVPRPPSDSGASSMAPVPMASTVVSPTTDSLAMMDYFMQKAAREARKRPQRHVDDSPPRQPVANPTQQQPPEEKASKRGHHMGDFIPDEELNKFMAKATGGPNSGPNDDNRIQSDNVGHRLLQKMGWSEGQGLGNQGSGRAEPIQAGGVKQNHLGVGAQVPGEVNEEDDIYEQYKKRMMLGYKHRPNPLGNPRKAYY